MTTLDPYDELDYEASAEGIAKAQINVPLTASDIERPRKPDGSYKFLFSLKKLWAFTGPGFLM